MRLPLLQSTSKPLWYAQGLSFTCQQCGNCCTGGPGYVWISREEVVRMADHLRMTPEQVVEEYCRTVDGKLSLSEVRTPAGTYDCVFLREQKGQIVVDGEPRTVTTRACAVYPVRPLQCRTWPFWPENLGSRKAWDRAARRCHGMNQGRPFDAEEIHRIRDAADWPEKPPTSGDEGAEGR